MPSVLIVDDDEILATLIKGFLDKRGYAASVEGDGARAVSRILNGSPEAVILDGNLPGKDGFEICREVRRDYHGVILMLTARIEDMDQILGLELGADDYLLKPTEPRVVEAHLKACLRRREHQPPPKGPSELRYGKFVINRAERTVRLDGKPVDLTTAEFELLWLLAENAGSVLTRDNIMKDMRHLTHDSLDRSIDMRVSRIRRRLGDDPDNPQRIKTVRGQGYLFNTSSWD